MVEKQRPRSGSKFSLKPQIAAAISAIPPLGYKAPPPLIGVKTFSSDVLALRARNYAKAYKTLSIKDWNSYAAFGLQQFASPSKYLNTRDSESERERCLRLGRYYRLHLEHKAPVDKGLMSQIVGIEAALQTAFPGYFDMSVVEMDEYLRSLGPEDLQDQILGHTTLSSPTDITETDQDVNMSNVEVDSLPTVHTDGTSLDVNLSQVMTSRPASPASALLSQEKMGSDYGPTTQEFQAILATIPPQIPSLRASSNADTVEREAITTLSTDSPKTTSTRTRRKAKAKKSTPSVDTIPTITRPLAVTNSARIEARWAPKDFYALKASSSMMCTRLAPILSSFNNQHSWMIEWQTDQLAVEQEISSSQLSNFLSIRVVPVTAQQCFYFSFRVNATGKQLLQVLQSKALKKAKRGENLTLDPSFIPSHHGEVVNIGDILLKDASVTHRSQYLKYCETLPSNERSRSGVGGMKRVAHKR
jgi:hypothetical protein